MMKTKTTLKLKSN